jgi:hypothetical protein
MVVLQLVYSLGACGRHGGLVAEACHGPRHVIADIIHVIHDKDLHFIHRFFLVSGDSGLFV